VGQFENRAKRLVIPSRFSGEESAFVLEGKADSSRDTTALRNDNLKNFKIDPAPIWPSSWIFPGPMLQ
jgi:hypothetical protein